MIGKIVGWLYVAAVVLLVLWNLSHGPQSHEPFRCKPGIYDENGEEITAVYEANGREIPCLGRKELDN